MDIMEWSNLQQRYTIAVFMDIKGAYDNLLPDMVEAEMSIKNMSPDEIWWIKNYLRNRTITAEYKGIKSERHIGKGTPQGGVLSPMLWNMAFDKLLWRLRAESSLTGWPGIYMDLAQCR